MKTYKVIIYQTDSYSIKVKASSKREASNTAYTRAQDFGTKSFDWTKEKEGVSYDISDKPIDITQWPTKKK